MRRRRGTFIASLLLAASCSEKEAPEQKASDFMPVFR